MKQNKEEKILLDIYQKAKYIITISNIDKDVNSKIIKNNVDVMINHIDSNKSVLGAVVTSCLKKIVDPKQDIRLHKIGFESGYSARSLDTNVTTPFFKRFFSKYANKETAFLTLSTRENIKWDLNEGYSIKIRNKSVKNSFLLLIDGIQKGKIIPEECIVYIFIKLMLLLEQNNKVINEVNCTTDHLGIYNINTVINILEKHFESNKGSRLPVIAIYTIYSMLLETVNRYKDKILKPLNVHTSSDKRGYGDIEIYNSDNSPFEIIEIKHNIPINHNMIFDIIKKAKNTSIQRYYILTTFKDCFAAAQEEEKVNSFCINSKREYDLEIIANGIIQSIKYYLRFIDDYHNFIKYYTLNLIEDSKVSTEIRSDHITLLNNILKEYDYD